MPISPSMTHILQSGSYTANHDPPILVIAGISELTEDLRHPYGWVGFTRKTLPHPVVKIVDEALLDLCEKVGDSVTSTWYGYVPTTQVS
jgi:hypothetical protein